MAGTYRIAAQPMLNTEGDFVRKLKGITFTATSATDARRWFAPDCSQFVAAFSKLMPRTLATLIVASLMHGDEVELPGLFREEQFESDFRYEWSPVHFIVSPAQVRLLNPNQSLRQPASATQRLLTARTRASTGYRFLRK
jgi:hypothetical protein